MLKTLLYYEFRGLRRIGLILLILLGVVSLSAMGVTFLLTSIEMSPTFGFLYSFLSLLDFGLYIAPLLLLGVAFIFCIYRFYATVFTVEGYLTLMLPLKRGTLLFGKMLSAVLFMVATVALVIVSYLISIGIPLVSLSGGTVVDVFELIRILIIGMPSAPIETLILVFTGLDLLVQGLSAVVLGHAAVIIGGVLLKKHKLLGAILFAIIIYYVREFVDLILVLVAALLFYGDTASYSNSYALLTTLLSLLLSAGVVTVGYVIAHKIFTKKLELE
jgi:hypothetical protein